MLNAVEISNAFAQYISEFDSQLRNGTDEITAENPLDFPDSTLSVFVDALSLNDMERAAIIFGAAAELHPLLVREFFETHYQQGENLLPIGTINFHLLTTLFDADPLLLSCKSNLLKLKIFHPVDNIDLAGQLLPFRIDPRVVQWLLGDRDPPGELSKYLIQPPKFVREMSSDLIKRTKENFRRMSNGVIQLFGPDISEQYSLALSVLSEIGREYRVISLETAALSNTFQQDLGAFERESKLSHHVYLVEAHYDAYDLPGEEWSVGRLEDFIRSLINHLHAPVFLLCRETVNLDDDRPVALVTVPHLSRQEQRDLWSDLLHLKNLENEQVRSVTDQFDLRGDLIANRINTIFSMISTDASDDQKIAAAWDVCRLAGRRRIGNLAERLTSQPSWEDLILPPEDLQVLQQIVQEVQNACI